MWFIRFAIDNPIKVTVGVILLTLFGLISLFRIPIQLTPNVDEPVVTVTTHWEGASPREVEREIIDRQEEKLKAVSDLRKMTSEAVNDQGTVTLEFFVGADKDVALREVSDKLRQVTDYPIEVDEPVVEATDSAISNPIAWLVISPLEPDVDVAVLHDYIDDRIKPTLERVPGVASVNIYGGLEREVHVHVDADRLASRKLTFRDLERALRGQNSDISAGTLAEGKLDFTVRTIGQFERTEDVERTIVAYREGGPVYVRDVAEVEIGYKKRTSFVRSVGRDVLAMPIRRETGSNVMEVMARLRVAIDDINEYILSSHDPKLALEQVYDETIYIDSAIALVKQNLVIGGGLAVLVLILFLRSASATTIVAVSIPISVIGSFLGVSMLGRSINVISLAGMSFAVGMVVDNAIVVLENIFRHRQMGKAAAEAAFEGAREVWGAVLASTLTTAAVFLPIVFVQEEAGQLFRDIALAIVVAVGLSLIVAITVIPTLSARLFQIGRKQAKPVETDKVGGRIAGGFAELVGAMNRSTFARVAIVVVFTLMAGVGSLLLAPPRSYLPNGNRNLVFGFLLTPPGYSLDEFRAMGNVIEADIAPYWRAGVGSPEAEELPPAMMMQGPNMQAAAGEPRILRVKAPPLDNFFFVGFSGRCFMGATSKEEDRVKPVASVLAQAGSQIPGVFPIFWQTSLFSSAVGGADSVDVEISGDDLNQVSQAAAQIRGLCGQKYGFRSVNPQPANFDLDAPEYRGVLRRDRAADLGLTARDLGFIAQTAVDGAFVGEFNDKGDKLDLRIKIKGRQGRLTQEIGDLPIYTPVGGIVPLSSAMEFDYTPAPQQINHIEELRSVTLSVTPPPGMALESIMNDIEQNVVGPLRSAESIPNSVQVSLAGNASKLREMLEVLKWDLVLAVVITYLLMAALFESFLYPFVVMFSVPLAAVGGFAGLRIVRWVSMMDPVTPEQSLDVLTMLGFVILIGVVVNNAILIVHQSLNNIRHEGMAANDAIRESVRTRTRPIFMSSLTSIFGMTPLVIMPGAGSELYRGLGSVVMGGLLVSTIFTLFVIPALFSLCIGAKATIVNAINGTSRASADAAAASG
jgi:HAE1 family hydrophobic/amphiphilic exporter-1